MRNGYKIHIPKTKYVKMAQIGLDIELRKNFKGMEFRGFYELAAKVTDMKSCLRKKVTGGRSPWEPIVKR